MPCMQSRNTSARHHSLARKRPVIICSDTDEARRQQRTCAEALHASTPAATALPSRNTVRSSYWPNATAPTSERPYSSLGYRTPNEFAEVLRLVVLPDR